MPWVYRVLRGKRVLARALATGQLEIADGKVEVRYKPGDGRAYRALAKNLIPTADGEVLPDEHCSAASFTSSGTISAPAIDAVDPSPETLDPSPETQGTSSKGAVVAFADGACEGNPGPCGLGAVILFAEHQEELCEYLGKGTNNIGELTAALRVLERVDPAVPVEIHTDSQYAIGVLSKNWKAKANIDLIDRIRAVIKGRRAKTMFHYVKGHAGIPGNERADALARAAVVSKTTVNWQRKTKTL